MSTENVPASHFNPLGSETQSVNTRIHSGGSSDQNESHLGRPVVPVRKFLEVLQTTQLDRFIFFICCYLIIIIKIRQRIYFLICYPPPPHSKSSVL